MFLLHSPCGFRVALNLEACRIASMVTLKRDFLSLSFYTREKRKGEAVKNKCGRDFLYYALNYHLPHLYSTSKLNPLRIDREHLFGTPVPSWLAWTQIQFFNLAPFLRTHHLSLKINDKKIAGNTSLFSAILFSRKDYDEAMWLVETSIQEDRTVGIDVSLGCGGLLDHVMFVYGFDAENVYVIDTHRVPGLEYIPVEDSQHYFRLPKSVIRDRWTRFGRVWEVCKT